MKEAVCAGEAAEGCRPVRALQGQAAEWGHSECLDTVLSITTESGCSFRPVSGDSLGMLLSILQPWDFKSSGPNIHVLWPGGQLVAQHLKG